ncbi:D-3-phosphoglycerate dehydrogenase, chloroplastic [Hordeum vulgare]|nr:D-3-phosphoglycerate dehydrogenase, chloroplastic [Hordeum vulgare]
MQFWSVDGAEEILGRRVRVDRLDSRTLERGHTKTFACWVWTNDLANIPTRHTLGVLPRGACRVEEMEGFSPPDRRVAPPPATAESAKKPLLAPAAVDGLAADVHAAAEAVLAEPLEFDKEALDRTPGEALQLDAFSPTLSASASDFG